MKAKLAKILTALKGSKSGVKQLLSQGPTTNNAEWPISYECAVIVFWRLLLFEWLERTKQPRTYKSSTAFT